MTKRIVILLAICLLLLGIREACAQQVRNGSTAFTAGGMGGVYRNQCGDDNVCNATNFGAKGDGLTDDWPALEAGYLAAYHAHKPFYLAPGSYLMNYPLVISSDTTSLNWDPVRVFGSGDFSDIFQSSSVGVSGPMPGIMLVPPDYVSSLGTIQTPAFVGGVGNAIQFNANKSYALRLNEVPMYGTNDVRSRNPIDGLAALTTRFYFKTPATSGGLPIWNSANVAASGTNGVTAVGGGALVAALTMSSGGKTQISGGTIAANTAYFGALVLCPSGCADAGENMYLYLCTPGQVGCSPVAKSAVTGSIVQAVDESMMLGKGWGYPPTNTSVDTFIGQIQSFDIEQTAVYNGGAITAPGADFTATANTLYLNNFSQVGGSITDGGTTVNNVPFAKVDNFNGTKGPGYQAIYKTTFDLNGRGQTLDSIEVGGATVGVFHTMEPDSYLHDILIWEASQNGLVTYNNTFSSKFQRIYAVGSGSATAGIESSWGGSTWQDIEAVGGAYGLAGWFGTQVHPILYPSSTTLAGIYISSSYSTFNSNVLVDPEVDNEAGGNAHGIIDQSCGSGPLVITGGQVIGTGTGDGIHIFNNNTFGCDDVTIVGTALWGTNAIGFDLTTPTFMPMVKVTNMLNDATNLSNKPEWVLWGSCGGAMALSGGTGTLSRPCISTGSNCSASDITTRSNSVTLAAPAAGSIGITGTGSDVVKVACQ